jgi:hypothetical protein
MTRIGEGASMIRVAETGRDWRDHPGQDLAEHLRIARVVIVPSGNADGRARCPYDSCAGETSRPTSASAWA